MVNAGKWRGQLRCLEDDDVVIDERNAKFLLHSLSKRCLLESNIFLPTFLSAFAEKVSSKSALETCTTVDARLSSDFPRIKVICLSQGTKRLFLLFRLFSCMSLCASSTCASSNSTPHDPLEWPRTYIKANAFKDHTCHTEWLCESEANVIRRVLGVGLMSMFLYPLDIFPGLPQTSSAAFTLGRNVTANH